MKSETEQFGLRKSLIDSIVELADKHGIEKLYLFGSRARGDYFPRSDIDLAAFGGNPGLFHLDAEDELPTLLFFDVVDLNRPISDELKAELERDAVLLYEKI